MSPVAQGPQLDSRKALAIGLAAVGVAIVVVLAIVVLSSEGGGVKVSLGDDVFRAGSASQTAETIAEARRPIAYPSLEGEDRPLLLNHIGEDPDTGWVGIIAVSPTKGSSCLVDWDLVEQDFYETCEPTVRFPPDGEGLEQVPVTVRDNALIVDINRISEG